MRTRLLLALLFLSFPCVCAADQGWDFKTQNTEDPGLKTSDGTGVKTATDKAGSYRVHGSGTEGLKSDSYGYVSGKALAQASVQFEGLAQDYQGYSGTYPDWQFQDDGPTKVSGSFSNGYETEYTLTIPDLCEGEIWVVNDLCLDSTWMAEQMPVGRLHWVGTAIDIKGKMLRVELDFSFGDKPVPSKKRYARRGRLHYFGKEERENTPYFARYGGVRDYANAHCSFYANDRQPHVGWSEYPYWSDPKDHVHAQRTGLKTWIPEALRPDPEGYDPRPVFDQWHDFDFLCRINVGNPFLDAWRPGDSPAQPHWSDLGAPYAARTVWDTVDGSGPKTITYPADISSTAHFREISSHNKDRPGIAGSTPNDPLYCVYPPKLQINGKLTNRVKATYLVELAPALEEPTDPTPPGQWLAYAVPPLAPNASPVTYLASIDGHATASSGTARGVRSDGECGRGLVSITLDTHALSMLVWQIETVPAGMAVLEGSVEIAPGEYAGHIEYEAVGEGAYEFVATLLAEDGTPTATQLQWEEVNTSGFDLEDTNLYLDFEGMRVGARGATLGALTIGRLPFAQIDTQPTVVVLSLADPEGILTSLPGTITIPAGETRVDLTIELTNATGEAVLTALNGAEAVSIAFECRDQTWALPVCSAKLPLNGRLLLPVEAGAVEGVEIDFATSSLNPDVAYFTAASGCLEGSGDFEALEVVPVAVGHASLCCSAAGLPTLEAEIEVVSTEVVVGIDCLQILDLNAGTEGVITLEAFEGITFGSVEVPTEAAGFITVHGEGTAELAVRIGECANRPSTVSLGLVFEGEAATCDFTVDVIDTYHGADAEPGFPYRVAVDVE